MITEKLIAILKENTVMIIDDKNIKEDTDFIEELGFDSLSIIRFITDVEREFNIEFDFEELVSEVIGKCDLTSRIQKTFISPVYPFFI